MERIWLSSSTRTQELRSEPRAERMDFEFLLVSRCLVDGGYLIPHAEKRAYHMAHDLNKLLLGPHMLCGVSLIGKDF